MNTAVETAGREPTPVRSEKRAFWNMLGISAVILAFFIGCSLCILAMAMARGVPILR